MGHLYIIDFDWLTHGYLISVAHPWYLSSAGGDGGGIMSSSFFSPTLLIEGQLFVRGMSSTFNGRIDVSATAIPPLPSSFTGDSLGCS